MQQNVARSTRKQAKLDQQPVDLSNRNHVPEGRGSHLQRGMEPAAEEIGLEVTKGGSEEKACGLGEIENAQTVSSP
jgi:hypothetical protein